MTKARVFGGLATGELWVEPLECRGACRTTVYMRILWEGRLRIHLRCPDCGSGRYLNRNPSPQLGKPAYIRRLDLDQHLVEIAADYQAGLALSQLGAKYHASQGIIHDRLLALGVPMRPARTPVSLLEPYRQLKHAQAQEKRARAHALRGEGYSLAEIARMMSTTRGYAKNLVYQHTHPRPSRPRRDTRALEQQHQPVP